MSADVIKYLSVFLLSMVKFFGGPLTGVAVGLPFWVTLTLSVTGMMTSVFIFSGVGSIFSNWYMEQRRLKQKPIFSKKSRRMVRVYQRFGISGIAFLTPVFFSPIIGTVMATVLGASQRLILLHMLWSAVLWGFIFTFALYELRHLKLPFLPL